MINNLEGLDDFFGGGTNEGPGAWRVGDGGLGSLLRQHFGGDQLDVDNMSYDDLLERFGTGSSTQRADARTIAALPEWTYRSCGNNGDGHNGSLSDELRGSSGRLSSPIDMTAGRRVGAQLASPIDLTTDSGIPAAKKSNADSNGGEGEEKPTCNICLEEYIDGDKLKTLPCLHFFHASCIEKWLKSVNKCPICKETV